MGGRPPTGPGAGARPVSGPGTDPTIPSVGGGPRPGSRPSGTRPPGGPAGPRPGGPTGPGRTDATMRTDVTRRTDVTGTGAEAVAAVGAPPDRPDVTRAARRVRLWHMVIMVVAAVSLFATCGLFSFNLLQDEIEHVPAGAGDPSETPARDISTRESDPEPLTVDEVFPVDEIVINPEEPPYELLGTQHSDDCGVAAVDALAELLEELGCQEVVRGTLRSPDGRYLVTTGVFNLESEADAEEAYERINPIIQDGTGRFVGMIAGEGTEPLVLSQTRLGWDYRGHFLLYAVVARADGEDFTVLDDRRAELVIWDMVEVHLRSGVIELRATADTGSEPSPTSSPSPAPSE